MHELSSMGYFTKIHMHTWWNMWETHQKGAKGECVDMGWRWGGGWGRTLPFALPCTLLMYLVATCTYMKQESVTLHHVLLGTVVFVGSNPELGENPLQPLHDGRDKIVGNPFQLV